MVTDAVQDFLSTIYNEVTNNHQWEFNGSRVHSCFTSPENGVMELTLENSSVLKVVISETTKPDEATLRCPCCQLLKPGWPKHWQNVAEGRSLMYACADCAAKKGKTNAT